MTANQARDIILTVLKALPDSELPEWKLDGDCIWFPSLSMGWNSASAPERLAESRITDLLAAEAAGRELIRRSEQVA